MKYQLYLSGPMSGVKDFNHPAFNAAASELRAAGYSVFNPVDNGVLSSAEWPEHMRADIKKLMDCHAVATLPGCSASKGARLEIYNARALGMRVATVGAWIDIKNEEKTC